MSLTREQANALFRARNPVAATRHGPGCGPRGRRADAVACAALFGKLGQGTATMAGEDCVRIDLAGGCYLLVTLARVS